MFALASDSFAMCMLLFFLVIVYHAFSLRKVVCCRKDYEALDPEEEQLLFCERERLMNPSLALVHQSEMLAIDRD